jgi:hypothetical protein
MKLSSRLSPIVALATLMLSAAAFAASPTPKATSGMIKKDTQTKDHIIKNLSGRSLNQGGVSGKGTVRRGGCEEWGCGATNGTMLTGIVPERTEAIEPVVSAVTLPSGETVALR